MIHSPPLSIHQKKAVDRLDIEDPSNNLACNQNVYTGVRNVKYIVIYG
jgi:hypothetical protein